MRKNYEAMNRISLDKFKAIYFIGIGGIGMSALARYFLSLGKEVGGYDRTPSELTSQLIAEGIWVHFQDDIDELPNFFLDEEMTLVIHTPAIPKTLSELVFFQKGNFILLKRAEVLGLITHSSKGLCVAGTHGKTTTSSMLAHILNESSWKCNAFLGGIATNFNSNIVLSNSSDWTVIEADEFDRSFLQLTPHSSIITAVDPDHLDIYGSKDQFVEGFRQYAMKSDMTGFSVQKEGLDLPSLSKVITYALNSETADYRMMNLRWYEGYLYGDVFGKNCTLLNIKLGFPGTHNAENALACIALLTELGMEESEIREGLATFLGVKRRFEYHIRTQDLVFLDDYAHHPIEIKSLIASLRMLYPKKTIIGVFQPHLFSRTRDFVEGFASELSGLDELILMPIYPAREEPIHGITSDWLMQQVKLTKKSLKSPSQVIQYFKNLKKGVVVTIGAGDIDRIVLPLKEILETNITE